MIDRQKFGRPFNRFLPGIIAAVAVVAAGISMLLASGLAVFRVKLFIGAIVLLAWSLVPAVPRPQRTVILLLSLIFTGLGLLFLIFLALVVR